jgi:UDP-N-acetylmuramoyl-L-alanyl-D-glutamate--2,6-diaminopimelate ligase
MTPESVGVTAEQVPLDPEITGLTADSRRVEPGHLFVALPGTRDDGRRFIDDAVARGAAAILVDAAAPRPNLPERVALLTTPFPRRALAHLAARFHGRQPRTIAAVTGTNGKTSTASFTRQLWAFADKPAASIGTLGIEGPNGLVAGGLTTPDPVALHEALAALARDGVEHVAMEASSHGLDQARLDGVRLTAAAFTNLTQDHLDYHGTMAAYFAAKRRLFDDLLIPGGTVVLNADVPEFAELADSARARHQQIIDYGFNARTIQILSMTPLPHGQRLVIEILGREITIDLALVGPFQAMNALAALGLALATGIGADLAVAGLARLQGVRGRVEHVATLPNGAPVFVDYAHTPDGLEKVLTALRPHTLGRLVCVFGAGGDRDPTKRPKMGEIVARLADEAIVTDDNPRGEDPAAIRAAILAACPGATEIGDRAAAIDQAIRTLASGDLLVIAGKGHEQGQTIAGIVHPFDDASVARACVQRLSEAP